MHRPVHPKSFYEWKTGSIEDRKFSDHKLCYCIVLCIIQYGTVICINTIDNIL